MGPAAPSVAVGDGTRVAELGAIGLASAITRRHAVWESDPTLVAVLASIAVVGGELSPLGAGVSRRALGRQRACDGRGNRVGAPKTGCGGSFPGAPLARHPSGRCCEGMRRHAQVARSREAMGGAWHPSVGWALAGRRGARVGLGDSGRTRAAMCLWAEPWKSVAGPSQGKTCSGESALGACGRPASGCL